jgi:hypothetical protein
MRKRILMLEIVLMVCLGYGASVWAGNEVFLGQFCWRMAPFADTILLRMSHLVGYSFTNTSIRIWPTASSDSPARLASSTATCSACISSAYVLSN